MEMSLPAKPQRREVVDLSGLSPVGRRPQFGTYCRQVWQRRHFIYADSRARITSSMRQMVLGNLWLILKPLLDGLAYALIFGYILKTSQGIDNFLGYLIIGVFMFQFTARCLSQGANSIVTGQNLLKGFTFPRAALPIASVVREIISMAPVLITMFTLILAAPPGAQITWLWLLFLPVIALQTVFNFGLALIAARLVAKVRDLSHLISVLTRFWLYGSGVFFSFERFTENTTLLQIVELNPLFQVLDMTRDLLLYATAPDVTSWLILAAWALFASVFGFVFFWSAEESYGRL